MKFVGQCLALLLLTSAIAILLFGRSRDLLIACALVGSVLNLCCARRWIRVVAAFGCLCTVVSPFVFELLFSMFGRVTYAQAFTELAMVFVVLGTIGSIYAGVVSFISFLEPLPYPPGFCNRCGYNLTGNASGVCPECGEKLLV